MIAVHHAITYASVIGFRPLALDLYVPEEPRAACVYLHGGGWRRGSRRDGPGHMTGPGEEFLERMAERQLAVAACDYRLSGEAIFPAQLEDVIAACRFVTSDLGVYGVSEIPLTLWGLSSGAHLAALAALNPRLDVEVAAVTCWSAPSDIARHQDDLEALGAPVDRGPGSREAQLLGGVVDELPDAARNASPVHHIRATSTRFELVHGTNDVHVPVAQSKRFAAALEETGTSATLVLVEGGDHFYKEIERDRLSELVDTSIDFLIGNSS